MNRRLSFSLAYRHPRLFFCSIATSGPDPITVPVLMGITTGIELMGIDPG